MLRHMSKQMTDKIFPVTGSPSETPVIASTPLEPSLVSKHGFGHLQLMEFAVNAISY